MPKTITIFLALMLLLAFSAGGLYIALQLTEQSREISNDGLEIVASIYPLGFFAEQVAGDVANVTIITPPGAEPHEYDITARDIARMQSADLIIINGSLEPWADDIQSILQDSSASVFVASDGLAASDPHVWLDPVLAKQEMLRITNAIKKADPERASEHMERAQRFSERFDELDELYQSGLASCQSRNIVTSHAAFHYLASRYTLNQVPISGLSPEEEPSTQTLIETTKFIQENNVKYIFFESLVSPKLAETIANETGAGVLELNPLEGLTADDIQQEKNYFTVMQSNLHNLQTALSCNR